jgi:hypothetical protein
VTIKPESEIASPGQIQSLLGHLEDWQRRLRQSQIKRRLRLDSPDEIDQEIIKKLRLLHLKLSDYEADTIKATIEGIRQWLQTAPVVHFTFPTPPPASFKKTVIDWLHQNVGSEVLAEFLVDGSIAAGFLLRTKNHLYNFSGNQVLWDNRAKIGELVKNV